MTAVLLLRAVEEREEAGGAWQRYQARGQHRRLIRPLTSNGRGNEVLCCGIYSTGYWTAGVAAASAAACF